MIESIEIANIATYGKAPEVVSGLSKINFLFGSNATGKTTISRVISDETNYPYCNVSWTGGTRLQPLVYNRDFVKMNFDQPEELKGIFTLGEQNIETLNKIKATKREHDELTKKIEGLKVQLSGDDGYGGKNGELASLESELKEKCWKQKLKHDAKLAGAFAGFRNSTENFKEKILREIGTNSAPLKSLADLENRAETVFGETPAVESTVVGIEPAAVASCESDPVLVKRVVGKEDVDIAAMIQKLGNSDWVKEGRTFYEANNMVCPFCQQSTPAQFAKSLEAYFDDAFERDNQAISELESKYNAATEGIQQHLESISSDPSRFLNAEALKAEAARFNAIIELNRQRIAAKKKEPSQIVSMESHTDVVTAIKAIVDAANAQIDTHNNMVANLAKERSDLTAQVWMYILETELKAELADYATKKTNLQKAVDSIEAKIDAASKARSAKADEIRSLEKETTSIQPTIDGINALLSSFGARAFELAKSGNGTSYRLVRQDGTDARETLSEGERAFVTFLYFYHLLKGSVTDAGTTTDRVVVFDDPVSSLDCDILFIVSSLIRGLFEDVQNGAGPIKQIFVFTHNVYFHKEVTFPRPRRALKDATFWMVRKPGRFSKLQKYDSNPIKTSYELLWKEVRSSERDVLSLQNTLRRILENYFKIMGGLKDLDDLCARFEGEHKLIARALFSWVNAGSHEALDDLYLSIDDSTVNTYLDVFKAIFEKNGHIDHYNMMMDVEHD